MHVVEGFHGVVRGFDGLWFGVLLEILLYSIVFGLDVTMAPEACRRVNRC